MGRGLVDWPLALQPGLLASLCNILLMRLFQPLPTCKLHGQPSPWLLKRWWMVEEVFYGTMA